MRERPWVRAAERALAPIGLGLMAGGAYTLTRSAVHDAFTAVLALVAFAILWRGFLPPIAVVLLGGIAGWLTGR